MEVYTCRNDYHCIKNLLNIYGKDYTDDYLKQSILRTMRQIVTLREKEDEHNFAIKSSSNQDVINHLIYDLEEHRQSIKMLCKKLKCLEQRYSYFIRRYCL
ncbi:hypothetical protein [Marinisporobacter balticus]|uniref:Uncharacterized protein n=1 Tax=Marinisporobacter balticus TaxID=2018667 RepID=A0A4R2KE58_9FIRM|nr:hypothetical protein [Marinisporobacter balticus]TCO70632.1 hypothetical protein EV214_1252 [Marinisporobacter balticus]